MGETPNLDWWVYRVSSINSTPQEMITPFSRQVSVGHTDHGRPCFLERAEALLRAKGAFFRTWAMEENLRNVQGI